MCTELINYSSQNCGLPPNLATTDLPLNYHVKGIDIGIVAYIVKRKSDVAALHIKCLIITSKVGGEAAGKFPDFNTSIASAFVPHPSARSHKAGATGSSGSPSHLNVLFLVWTPARTPLQHASRLRSERYGSTYPYVSRTAVPWTLSCTCSLLRPYCSSPRRVSAGAAPSWHWHHSFW
ncbi:hypothetical protein FIBSPDRAFT_999299 [Athelia psychrophila]|uniref:Uncharacterized protein n=1 Tax=Athelia psychrophila TaxID=1759441 RepID=A0A167X892_9AGAM|nr:hypothetical protein FIBSPDRAFT_999299 [Fibularhizoctonia sp. CBS 109695]